MLLVKLGGSVITNKERECTFLPKTARRLVEEMRYGGGPMVVTHGGGSFGHKKAAHYKLREGLDEALRGTERDQVAGFAEVQEDMRALNQNVIGLMNKFGLAAVTVPTCAVVSFSGGRLTKMDTYMFDRALAMGAVPVAFGDVVFDSKLTFTICSADDLMLALARKYRPERAIFVMDVDGIFDKDPYEYPGSNLVTEVRSRKDLPPALRKAGSRKGVKDVTGGIGAKAEVALAMASLGVETILINGCVANRLNRTIKGQSIIGTRFVPRGKGKKGKGGKRGKGARKKGGGR